jgi:glycyl-tRNA synthetase
MITPDYVKKYLIENKIIFPTNQYDNNHTGFQNYGPIGLKIKNKIIDEWRNVFINKVNNIFEIEAPVISTETVLLRSGHVQKFNDLGIIFYDKTTNKIKCIKRADHFIEDKIDELKLINTIYEDNNDFVMNFLITNNLFDQQTEYVEIKPISLMFKMDGMKETLYLRPEIAQTIFTEFKHFYEYNNCKLPFGIAQTGHSYRNEICDKPFVRLREFTQAEIEYFYLPSDLNKLNFNFNYDKPINILSADMQINESYEINSCFQININELTTYISNPILRDFVCKLLVFSENIGLDHKLLRLRQHRKDEMAHYANDCWDLEANIFGKWLEITGIADRGNYDLTVHDKDNTFLIKSSSEPVIKYKLLANSKKIFKENNKETAINIIKQIDLSDRIFESKDDIMKMFELNSLSNQNLPDIKWYNIIEYKHFDYIRPSVVEPSIGIDRVFYTLICHNLFLREDGLRPYLVLPKELQPYNFMLAQLSNHPDLIKKFNEIINLKKITKYNIYTDMSSTTIGKRYTRADELGIQYSVTIDFETLKDNSVTIRNLLDMQQIRVDIHEIDKYLL